MNAGGDVGTDYGFYTTLFYRLFDLSTFIQNGIKWRSLMHQTLNWWVLLLSYWTDVNCFAAGAADDSHANKQACRCDTGAWGKLSAFLFTCTTSRAKRDQRSAANDCWAEKQIAQQHDQSKHCFSWFICHYLTYIVNCTCWHLLFYLFPVPWHRWLGFWPGWNLIR